MSLIAITYLCCLGAGLFIAAAFHYFRSSRKARYYDPKIFLYAPIKPEPKPLLKDKSLKI